MLSCASGALYPPPALLRLRGRYTRRLPSSLGRFAPPLPSPVGGAPCSFAPPGALYPPPSLVPRSLPLPRSSVRWAARPALLRLRGRYTRRLPSSLGRFAPSLLSPVGGAPPSARRGRGQLTAAAGAGAGWWCRPVLTISGRGCGCRLPRVAANRLPGAWRAT